jgi:hypothetical protein
MLTSKELAIARQMDRAADSPTIAEHPSHVCGHGYIWDHDRTWPILQVSEAVRGPIRVRRCISPLAMSWSNQILSVCTAAGDRVPGPRSLALLSPVEFPWRDSVDAIEEVGSKDAFSLSLELCRAGLICGPSSGFNLQGRSIHRSIHA